MAQVMRCYDDDAAQLVDVCRQCICFATVQDMATCLHCIRQHPALEVPPWSSLSYLSCPYQCQPI